VKAAFDTNILAYAEGANDGVRQADAKALIRQIPDRSKAIPVQALGELYNVPVRKSGWSANQARSAIAMWRSGLETIPTTVTAMIAAVDVVADHRLSIWDGIMLTVAAEGGCELLISEDFQDGFTWGGVTVANPFAATKHPLLEALLGG
jgi:predicted nucleic acid-binding protein